MATLSDLVEAIAEAEGIDRASLNLSLQGGFLQGRRAHRFEIQDIGSVRISEHRSASRIRCDHTSDGRGMAGHNARVEYFVCILPAQTAWAARKKEE
jgi:hypothetical protein